ncbi:MAG TPA: DnaA regulatory inactivator Hda [Steroidobacteraceae bacterium]|jgi:DnaA family protein
MQQLPLAMRLRERAVFDSFVAGPNAQAVQALREIAAGVLREPVWLCGPVGAGKSHLLQALCAQAQCAQLDAAYLPMRQLRQLGVEALSGWQHTRVLALDDVDALAGQRDWEQPLFGLFREAQERGAVLVGAAVEPPRRVPFALPDLASRFAAATLLTLQPLNEAEQREALRLRARARGLELPEDTALYLQRRFPRDLPTLYQLLDTLDEAALAAQRRVTVPFIRSVLEP